MAKMVEVRLKTLTCEFSGSPGESLRLGGRFLLQGFDRPESIATSATMHDFGTTPHLFRKGDVLPLNIASRVTMATPSQDPPGFGSLFIKFGGELFNQNTPGFTPLLGSEWQVLGTADVTNFEVPFEWHLYFGRSKFVIRADFESLVAHNL